ncbi:MAG: MFS transporter [Acidobacteria bacterium]|nr:MAG: MFS transporter [Acidobacteriota bacterium]
MLAAARPPRAVIVAMRLPHPDAPRHAAGSRTLLGLFGFHLAPGEGRLLWTLFWLHFLLLAFQYASKSVRQASYVDALGAERLPFVYLLIALASYPVLMLYSRVVDRWSVRRVMAGSCFVVAASMAGFWWLFGLGGDARRWVSVAFYLWIAIAGIFLVSQLWSVAGRRLDPRQARRLFGFVGAGGLLGGMAGGLLATLASRVETRSALAAAGALLLVAGLLATVLGPATEGSAAPRRTPRPGELRDGLRTVRGSRYLRLIAVLVLLSTVVAQVVDMQFSWAIESRTASLDERTAVFGTLYGVMGLMALVFQLLFTTRILRRLGIGFALRMLPLSNAAGSAFFAVAAHLAPGLLLPAAWLLKITENGLRYSIDQASRELLFLPVAAAQRPRAKVFIDLCVQRAAKGAAALLLLSVTFGWLEVRQTAWISLALVVLWLAVVGAARRRYVAAYRESLRQGEPEVESGLDLEDAATLEILIEGLGSAQRREVLHSLTLLASHGRGRLVPPLMLRHPDAAVRVKVLEILQEAGRKEAVPLVEELLADGDPAVRAAAARALARLTPSTVQAQMAARLHDASARVRAAAVGYLMDCRNPALCTRARTVLAEMRTDGDPAVRRAAARALGEIEAQIEPGYLVQLLYDGDGSVVLAAIDAVRQQVARGVRRAHYIPILVSHLRNRRFKHEARDALVAYGEMVIPALQHFMRDRQEQIWVRRALPKTIATIGGRAALSVLVAELAAPDPFLRRKVIEALGQLRASAGLKPEAALVEGQLAAECAGYLRALLDLSALAGDALPMRGPLVSWPHENGGAHLLERLLAGRMRDHLRNVFGLLALLHPPRDVRAAWRGLCSAEPRLRAHALEYLDNLLAGDHRRLIFAAIDELPMDERLRRAGRYFAVAPASRGDTLRRLATRRPADDADAVWITAAALCYVHDRRLRELYPLIHEAAAADPASLVQETTAYLLARLAGPGGG